jgi:hypothetical protein
MPGIKEKIGQIAARYGLQIIYAFGSRANEALEVVEGRIEHFSPTPSDMDIGVKPERRLTVEDFAPLALRTLCSPRRFCAAQPSSART